MPGVKGSSFAGYADGTFDVTDSFRVLGGRASNSCQADETLISAYCTSSATEITSAPIIIPPRSARCLGILNVAVVITCAKL